MRPISKLSLGLAVATILFITYPLKCFGGDLVNRLDAICKPYIIQGRDTPIEKVPYQVAIERFGIHICGGSILSDTWVVTTAHCIHPNVTGKYEKEIRAGTAASVPLVGWTGSVHGIERTEIHKKFNFSTLDFDIAVLKVSKKFNFSSTIQPVKLPMSEIFIDYKATATISGWGKTSVDALLHSTQLQSAEVPILTRSECLSIFDSTGLLYYLSRRMICAGGKGSDTSQGDSGGPLVQNKQLIGLASWGFKPAKNRVLPSVFTNVLRFEMRTFINDHTGL